MSKISKITQNPSSFASQEPIEEVISFLKNQDQSYYSGDGTNSNTVSDNVYDLIKDALKKRDPTNMYFKQVGAPVISGKKVELPYFMGSMDKIKTDNSILKRFSQMYTGKFVVSDKLDGVSGMFHWQNNNVNLFTRGNGFQGQNISWLLPHIKGTGLYKNMKTVVIRGEIIIDKSDFQAVKHKGANARNMVSGIVNSKRPDPNILSRVQFVAYSLIEPKMEVVDQMKWLEKNGWTTVHYQVINNSLQFEQFQGILQDRKQLSKFDIDGIIINHNEYHPIIPGSNPEHAFAFKATEADNMVNVTVSNVEWNVSKHGLLKPVIQFDPVNLGGVIIKRATGFNAQYVNVNKIGPGSKLVITRSGDVIPYIKEVKSISTSGLPMMPTSYEFHWNKSGIDIVIENHEEDKEVAVKTLISFFTKIKVPGFSISNVRKMYDNGFINVLMIMNARLVDFQDVIGKVNGQKIYQSMNVQKNNIDCVTLMDASNVFGPGFGTRRLQSIMQAIPAIEISDYIPTEGELIQIDGVSNITAIQFIKGLEKFTNYKNKFNLNCVPSSKIKEIKEQERKRRHENEDIVDKDDKQKKTNHNRDMSNEQVIFTGFRDKDLHEKTERLGGKIASSLNKKTTILVYKQYSDTSVKIQQAKTLGVKMMDIEEYVRFLG